MARPRPIDTSLIALAHPRYWLSWMWLILLRLLSHLPLRAIWLLGAVVGMALYVLYASRRHVARRNLERCFPKLSPKQREQLVRRHFRALGQTLLDNGIAWWASKRRLRRLFYIRGREHYDRALAHGQNIILLVPHFLGLEVAVSRLALEQPMVTVFRHPDNVPLRVVVERGRKRFGLKLIEHNQPFTSLVRAVKSGMPLYYLPDQDAGRRNAVFAPFFGIPASTFAALGRLARITDAVVIPCIVRQRAYGRGYEILFQPPLKNFPTGDSVADAARMNAEIENVVRKWPAQYFWVHKRFKTRPEGEKNFYAQ